MYFVTEEDKCTVYEEQLEKSDTLTLCAGIRRSP